ncbi:MAG: hypothetical protein EA344_03020 [Alkalicoccus sp.]|nr:MAG: hypothetical protein EA344_03020 [Alkalicoccus sp.]
MVTIVTRITAVFLVIVVIISFSTSLINSTVFYYITGPVLFLFGIDEYFRSKGFYSFFLLVGGLLITLFTVFGMQPAGSW